MLKQLSVGSQKQVITKVREICELVNNETGLTLIGITAIRKSKDIVISSELHDITVIIEKF